MRPLLAALPLTCLATLAWFALRSTDGTDALSGPRKDTAAPATGSTPASLEAVGGTAASDRTVEPTADEPVAVSPAADASVESPRRGVEFEVALEPGASTETLGLYTLAVPLSSHRTIFTAEEVRATRVGDVTIEGSTLRVLTDAPERELRRMPKEIRSDDRTTSSGLFREWPSGDRRISLLLRPVARAEVRLRGADTSLDLADAVLFPDVSRTIATPNGSRNIFQHFRTTVEWESTVEGRVYRVERALAPEAVLRVRSTRFEDLDVPLRLVPGSTDRHDVALLPIPTTGPFLGTVTLESGAAPGRFAELLRVRVQSVADRRRQYTLEPDWKGSAGSWRTEDLPAGEYRVWLDGAHAFRTTPKEVQVLSPPQSSLDWVVHDTAERRDLGLALTYADTGQEVERYSVVRRWTPTLFYENDRESSRVLKRDVPIDSPTTWEVGAEGYGSVVLSVADFTRPGFVDARGREVGSDGDGSPIWFADVRLQRWEGLAPAEREAIEARAAEREAVRAERRADWKRLR